MRKGNGCRRALVSYVINGINVTANKKKKKKKQSWNLESQQGLLQNNMPCASVWTKPNLENVGES